MTDAPMPLGAAVQICFPHGGATISTLRRAIRAGELHAEVIGRQYMVTQNGIEHWRETACRDRAKARAFISAGNRGVRQFTLSVMERQKLAQAALQRMLEEPHKPSSNTSQNDSGPTLPSAASTGSRLQKS